MFTEEYRDMKLRTIIATAATAAVLASSGVALAGAATSTDSSPTPAAKSAPAAAPSARPARARRFRMRRQLRRLARGAAGVVTKTIGIDRKTLRTELRGGKTIAQIATDHNVNPQTVIDALVAAANKKIDAAVAAGNLAPKRAERIEARLPARITKLVNNWHPKRVRNNA
jgi:ribosomal protein S20